MKFLVNHSEGNQANIFTVTFHLSFMDNLNMEGKRTIARRSKVKME